MLVLTDGIRQQNRCENLKFHNERILYLIKKSGAVFSREVACSCTIKIAGLQIRGTCYTCVRVHATCYSVRTVHKRRCFL